MGCRLIAAVSLGILLAGPASGQERGDLDRGLAALAAGDPEQAVVLLLAARAGGLGTEDETVAVRGLQQALQQAGYPAGAADGVWRSRTYDALWTFAIDRCAPQRVLVSLCDWLLAEGGLDARGQAVVFAQRGAALLEAGNTTGAQADAASAIAADGGYAPGQLLLSRSLLAAGDPRAALQAVDAAIALDPLPAYHAQRGALLMHLDRPADAIAALETVLETWPGDPATLAGLGRARFVLGDYGAAADDFMAAADADPAEASHRIAAARAFCAAASYVECRDQAAAALDMATGVHTGSEARFLLGVAQYGLGDVAAAVTGLLAVLRSEVAPAEAAQFLKGVLGAAGMLLPDQESMDRADLVSAADRYLSTIRSP